MLYGKAGLPTDLSSHETWTSDYLQVTHLENSSFPDATSCGNFGVNTETVNIQGKLGQAESFDGVNDKIVVNDDPNLDGTKTRQPFALDLLD